MKIAITCTTRQPPQSLSRWCDFHLRIADRVFLWLDHDNGHHDNAQLSALASSDARLHIAAGSRKDAGNVHDSLWRRQDDNANAALKLCLEERIDVLCHIDDDELLFGERNDFISLWSAGVGQVSFVNHEVCPVWASEDVFRDCIYFKVNRRGHFNFYNNGKAAVRCGEQVRASGQHGFAGFSGSRLTTDKIVVLHYPCATFERWLDKYRRLGDFPGYWNGSGKPIELPFHLKSRDIHTRYRETGDLGEARAFFAKEVRSDEELMHSIARGEIRVFEPL